MCVQYLDDRVIAYICFHQLNAIPPLLISRKWLALYKNEICLILRCDSRSFSEGLSHRTIFQTLRLLSKLFINIALHFKRWSCRKIDKNFCPFVRSSNANRWGGISFWLWSQKGSKALSWPKFFCNEVLVDNKIHIIKQYTTPHFSI